jgi:hypothetical protein
MHPAKKQLEIALMNYFMEFFPDFPNGSLLPTESPDFILTFKNRHQLGIELTRLNPENAAPPDPAHLKEIEFREHLIGMARDLFERDNSYKLFVKFLFSEEKSIGSEREISVAVQVANLIRKAVGKKKLQSFFKITVETSELPEGLDGLLIVNHPALDVSFWERSNNLGISNNVVADIRMAIHKKDEKLRLYQKQRLNYYWLLITTDRLRGVKSFNLPDKIMNHKFHSNFQHVFLFDLIKSNVFQLV